MDYLWKINPSSPNSTYSPTARHLATLQPSKIPYSPTGMLQTDSALCYSPWENPTAFLPTALKIAEKNLQPL